ncbi:MAG: sodium-dependent transporter [Gammaproteobacteria bacterium]|nr:sodium-dependent transporter [Gammaproteobacteria bacterium]
MAIEQQREHWSSRWAFVLAATGSAVGLGNIWKFPYIAGENGGGAFVLVYLLCIAAIGVPIMAAEILLGRRGQNNPVATMQGLAREAGAARAWSLIGWFGVLAGFLILSYYSVIAGWTLAYVVRGAGGAFQQADSTEISRLFADLVADPERLLAWHTLFMALTTVVVARGVSAGLERAVRLLLPGMLGILLLLVGYAWVEGDVGAGLRFLFTPDFSALSWDSVLIALGHAFFTLSLGMGSIMVYGSYMRRGSSIASTTLMVAAADTVIALLAGLAIFPIVFAQGLEVGSGPGLVFETLPNAFGHMPGGRFFGTLFFLLLLFAAWSSSISLIEPAVAWMSERFRITRPMAAGLSGAVTWVLGLATVLSFNLWAEKKPFWGMNPFEFVDYLTANLMLPLGGLAIALFVGWRMGSAERREEFDALHPVAYNAWLWGLRVVAPTAVLVVFYNAVFG